MPSFSVSTIDLRARSAARARSSDSRAAIATGSGGSTYGRSNRPRRNLRRSIRSTARSRWRSSRQPPSIIARSGPAKAFDVGSSLSMPARSAIAAASPRSCGELMLPDEHLDRGVVGRDEAVEPPLLAQDRRQELPGHVAGQAVDLAVGRHHAREARFAHRDLERQQLLVAQLPWPGVGGRLVEPALREAVPDEVLPGRGDALGEVRSLDAAHVRRPEDGGEIRVLAVGLLDPAPARIAGDVEDGREREPPPDREHPPADGVCDGPDEPGSNAAAAPIDCWNAGASRARSPCSVSSWSSAGIPRRVCSTRNRWIALPAAAAPAVSRFVAPATRLTWPIPFARRVRRRSGSSSVSLRNSSNDQREPTWASFSSSVMRASRSATRSSIESSGSR